MYKPARVMRELVRAQKGEPWNETRVWRKQRNAIAARVERKQSEAHARAVVRKETVKEGSQDPKELAKALKIVATLEKKKADKKPFISKRSQKRAA